MNPANAPGGLPKASSIAGWTAKLQIGRGDLVRLRKNLSRLDAVELATTGLQAALKGDLYASNYFRVFGVVYALVAVWGISALTGGFNDNVLFGLIHVNMATELLHIAIAVVSLYIGFVQKPVKA